MARKLLTREELSNWMTAELRKIEDCAECSIGEVYILAKPDDDGCNWSQDVVIRSGGVAAEYLRPIVEKIVGQARAQFNVQ